jgi:hypothetical protein
MAIRERASDFSVVGPGPPFCHRKTRKIPGGDWPQRSKTGRFLRENALFVRSGKALFWGALSRSKMCQNAKNRREAAGLVGFEAKQGPFLARE